jgi:hypothetical protein
VLQAPQEQPERPAGPVRQELQVHPAGQEQPVRQVRSSGPGRLPCPT